MFWFAGESIVTACGSAINHFASSVLITSSQPLPLRILDIYYISSTNYSVKMSISGYDTHTRTHIHVFLTII